MDFQLLNGLVTIHKSDASEERGLKTRLEGQTIHKIVQRIEAVVSDARLEDNLINNAEVEEEASKVAHVRHHLSESFGGINKLRKRLENKLKHLKEDIAKEKGVFARITTLFMKIKASAYTSLISRLVQANKKLSAKIDAVADRLDSIQTISALKALGYKYGKEVTEEILYDLVEYLKKHKATKKNRNDHILGYLRQKYPNVTFETPKQGFIDGALFKSYIKKTLPKSTIIIPTISGTRITPDQAKSILRDLGYQQPTLDNLAQHLVKKGFCLEDPQLGLSNQEKFSFNSYVVDFLLTEFPDATAVAMKTKQRWFNSTYAVDVRIINSEEYQGLHLEFKYSDLRLSDRMTQRGETVLKESAAYFVQQRKAAAKLKGVVKAGARLKARVRLIRLKKALLKEQQLQAMQLTQAMQPKPVPAAQTISQSSEQTPPSTRSDVRAPSRIAQISNQAQAQPLTLVQPKPKAPVRTPKAPVHTPANPPVQAKAAPLANLAKKADNKATVDAVDQIFDTAVESFLDFVGYNPGSKKPTRAAAPMRTTSSLTTKKTKALKP